MAKLRCVRRKRFNKKENEVVYMRILVDLKDFPASKKFTYLNAASIGLMWDKASAAIIEWQEDLALNGTSNFDEKAEEEVFEQLRQFTASLLNANPADIAGGSSATELMSSVAWAVMPPKGTNIISCDVVHPSSIYPWVRVARHTGAKVIFAKNTNGYIPPERLYDLIDKSTSIVCISHVEYSGGQIYDLKKLAEKAHAVGALLVVDATQSAGAVPINVRAMGVDVLVSGSYKWLTGPFGVAVLYLAPHLQKKLNPGLVGWRSHRDMWDFDSTRLVYADTAKKFEFSTMSYGNVIGLTKAMEYLLKLGIKEIQEFNMFLADLLIEGFKKRGAEIISPEKKEERSSIVSIRFPRRRSSEIARHLNANNIIISQRKDFLRFSPHLYNTVQDINKVFQVLDKVL